MTPLLADTLFRFLGRLHVLTVHFPIALIIAAGAFELFGSWRKQAEWRHSGYLCLIVATLCALVTVWFGWLNAEHEPHAARLQDLIERHRWFGVGTAALGVVALICGMRMRRTHTGAWRSAYRIFLGLAVATVAISGHLGGELVHGTGYLTALWQTDEPAAPTDSTPPAAADSTAAVDFARDIQPIFDARCIGCHGAERPKAMLRLDAAANLFADDPALWVVQPGTPQDSSLYQRISLPADDIDLMPADGGPLTTGQIELIRQWIADGAVVPAG